MADLAIGVARSVVEVTVTKAQSAIEEKKLRQDAQRDLIFITGEFQMMQSFLRVVDEERSKNPVVRGWVDQVRDLAYDVEDCIELVDHLDSKSDWWRRLLPGCIAAVLPLDNVVAEIKLLKARVEDVSHRCTRYGLTSIIDFDSKPVVEQETASYSAMSASYVDTTNEQPGIGDLTQLIARDGRDLEVISVCGYADDLGAISIIRKAYEYPEVSETFGNRGWLKLEHPFNPRKFVKSVVAQFYNSCLQQQKNVDVAELDRMERILTKQGGSVGEFMEQMSKRFLLVLENVCSIEDWEAINKYIPDRKNGSRIIVYTEQLEIAKVSFGDSNEVLELKGYESEYPVLVFYKQGSLGEIVREMSTNVRRDVYQRAHCWMKEFTLVGREAQMKDLRNYHKKARSNDWHVMSVWGIPGVGKSALVRNFYYHIMLEKSTLFQKYGWINVTQPFNRMDFYRKVLLEFNSESIKYREIKDPIIQCRILLKACQCLLVIDGLQSVKEWDIIQNSLLSGQSESFIIVITDQENIAAYCSDHEEIVVNVKGLEAEASFHLFKNEVRRRTPNSYLLGQTDTELAEHILKCGGIPKVIISVADFLAPKTITAMESKRTVNCQFMNNLHHDPESGGLKGLFLWLDSYIGTCPDFLKQCILYLSIFSQAQGIRRRRILRRWIVEGYIKNSEKGYAEHRGEWYFSKLLDVCIVKFPPHSVSRIIINYTRTVLFQINMLVGQYILSGPKEENLFLELEKSCILTPHRIGRHIIIRKNWDRDRTVFESIDFLRLRSLTVFGEWKSFFISEYMKVLRVLDLEDSTGVTDKDLENIVNLLSRLKFLSLRGCREISRLPRKLGDLRQLETLDVRHTSVDTIPAAIMKLKKLQYLRVGTTVQTMEEHTRRTSVTQFPQFCRNQPVGGVKLPEGIGRLTLLSTLGSYQHQCCRQAAHPERVKEAHTTA